MKLAKAIKAFRISLLPFVGFNYTHAKNNEHVRLCKIRNKFSSGIKKPSVFLKNAEHYWISSGYHIDEQIPRGPNLLGSKDKSEKVARGGT